MATDVIISLIILLVGIAFGYLIKSYLVRRSLSGTIHVTRNEGRTLYSLDLSDYPETLEFKKFVIFDVDATTDEPDRE